MKLFRTLFKGLLNTIIIIKCYRKSDYQQRDAEYRPMYEQCMLVEENHYIVQFSADIFSTKIQSNGLVVV